VIGGAFNKVHTIFIFGPVYNNLVCVHVCACSVLVVKY